MGVKTVKQRTAIQKFIRTDTVNTIITYVFILTKRKKYEENNITQKNVIEGGINMKKTLLLFLILMMLLGLGINTYAEEPALTPDEVGPAFSLSPEFFNASDVQNADELRQQVSNKTAELEQMYGIKIAFEDNLTGASYLSRLLGYLSLLEETIKEIPTELYFSARAQLTAKGKILTVYFYQEGKDYNYVFVQAGFYDFDTVTINLNSDALYMNPPGLVQSFLHEYAHMLHLTLLDYTAFESRWTALNGGVQYTNEMWYVHDENIARTFISYYASSSYGEDFAESFAYFVVLPGDFIQQEAMKEPDNPAIQKMLLLREILSESFSIDPLVFLPF